MNSILAYTIAIAFSIITIILVFILGKPHNPNNKELN